jgi:hypothetical protein
LPTITKLAISARGKSSMKPGSIVNRIVFNPQACGLLFESSVYADYMGVEIWDVNCNRGTI